MLENDNKLVVAVITDNADVPSSSAPNTKARRGKVPTPSVTFATPELESSPVDIPQTTETQESFSLTEDIWPIMKQINECRMKNADTLNIPGQLVKVERLSSNSGKWKTRFIAETGSVPTLGVEPKNLGRTLDSKPLKATVARVWPPGNNYRPDVVLLSYPDVRHKFIAIVRDNLDDSVLFRHPHSNRETPDQALHRLDREIEKKFPPGKGVTPLPPPRRPKDIKYYTRVLKEEQILRQCLKWKKKDFSVGMAPPRESRWPYRAVVKQKDTDDQIVKSDWFGSEDEAYEDLSRKVRIFEGNQMDFLEKLSFSCSTTDRSLTR